MKEKKKVLKVTGNLVLVKQKVIKERESGIIIPDAALKGGEMELFEGTVVATGPSARRVSKGDYIRFTRNGFSTTTIDGVEYILIFESGIPMIIKEVDDENYQLDQSEVFVSIEDGEEV
jgi:co-chaperonin GroES (HSP10)